MDILAPWSLSTYLPLNGFHPLYRSLANRPPESVRIFTPKAPDFAELQKLVVHGFYKRGPFKFPPTTSADMTGDDSVFFNRFIKAHGTRDIWIQSNLPGEVELHHTAPATCGDRPFVLHCESFLPVFFPFFQQGTNWNEKGIEQIRAFYRDLFENENCLGVISHLPETLKQFSVFFQSDVIDKKLVAMPIGLDASYLATPIEKSSEVTRFVFLNSAHQNPLSFTLRGGISSLKLALNLLRERNDVLFYFRTRRPSESLLRSYGINSDELKQYETTKIVWVENYLSTEALNTLIARCHFLLLPSANLHSVSIMSALGNGTVPIVTDTIGTDVYAEDMVNSIVIRGVGAEIWSKDDGLRITRDRHDRFTGIEEKITTSLIKRVREALDAPQKLREMSEAGRRTVMQRFDGAAFANRLIEDVKARSIRALGYRSSWKKRRIADNERWIEDVSPTHFKGPPQPVERIKLDNGSIYQLGNEFLFIPLESFGSSKQRDFWSPISWWGLDRFGRHFPQNARAIRAEKLHECLNLARGTTRPFRMTTAQRLYVALKPYRVPYVFARQVYRVLKWSGASR